jgi:hypothetical protein
VKVTKKEKLPTVNLISILIQCLNYKTVTGKNATKSNLIAHFNSCEKIACRSAELIFTFFYVYPPFFCKLRPSNSTTDRNITVMDLEFETALSFSVTIQSDTNTKQLFSLAEPKIVCR